MRRIATNQVKHHVRVIQEKGYKKDLGVSRDGLYPHIPFQFWQGNNDESPFLISYWFLYRNVFNEDMLLHLTNMKYHMFDEC